MLERQNQLRKTMRENGLDAVLLSSAVSIRYYTGFTSDECIVLLTMDSCHLITDFRYTIQAVQQCGDAAEILEVNAAPKQMETARGLVEQKNIRTCGYEDARITVKRFNEFSEFGIAFRPFSAEIEKPRLIKSDLEVAEMQKAQEIADAAFSRILGSIRPGVTEKEIAAELLYQCAVLGSEGPSFDPIVGSGENGAMCHAIPSDRKIRGGDLIVLDFGCKYHGYCSDMTRTVGIGTIDPELRKIYDITLETQLKCLDAVHSGIRGYDLHMIAVDNITAHGYGKCFGHGLGHGFGLEIHEQPRASAVSADTLLTGMTITVEPGIYLEGKGGVRIEDCGVVTDHGYRNFATSTKELIIL